MLKTMFAAATAIVLCSGAALADAYVPPPVYTAPPVAYAPAWTWSGFYFGAHGGVLFNETEVDTVGLAPGNVNNVRIGARPANVDFEDELFMGGGQIGYNHQMGSWVIGVEADYSSTDSNRTQGSRIIGTGGNPSSFFNQLETFGTVRGRVGWASNRWLGYFTAGYAFADVDNRALFFTPDNEIQFTSSPRTKFGSRRNDFDDGENVDGYAIGGGAEFALTENVTFKGEGLWYDLDDTRIVVDNVPGVGSGAYASTFENEGFLLRAGVNFKFRGIFNR